MSFTPKTPEQKAAMSVLDRWLTRYAALAGEEGPVQFVREVFGAEPDEWQREVLEDIGRGERRISIRSCHGVGKTCLLAWLVWYMLLTRYPQKTVATAPTQGQLFDGLFSEVMLWHARLPEPMQALFTVKSNRIELKAHPAGSFFTCRTARAEQPEALQGIHSHNVLIIGDEASGIPEAIFEAGSGSMSGNPELGEFAVTVLAGNPVRTTGFFFESHHRTAHMWRTYHVCAAVADWPSGIPSGRPGADYVEEQAVLYGLESNAYRIRVLGEFPKGDDDQVIPYHSIISASEREIKTMPNLPCVWGVDVARFGSAKNALVVRNKRRVLEADYWEGVDLMQTAGKIKHKWDNTLPGDRPYVILIDVVGLGGGVVDRLLELKLPVRGINVAETGDVDPRFDRLRSELWWRAREWLLGLDVAIEPPPKDCDPKKDPVTRMISELAAPKYKIMSSGRIHVESKDEMRKRGVASPDIADALVLTFAEDVSLMTGGLESGGANWNEELPSRAGGIV